jgi:hypothetical protein
MGKNDSGKDTSPSSGSTVQKSPNQKSKTFSHEDRNKSLNPPKFTPTSKPSPGETGKNKKE